MKPKKCNDFVWQGRQDKEDGESGLRWHQQVNLQNYPVSCSLVGFASDLGVEANKGRVGASQGPMAIRAALSNLAWHGKANLLDKGDIVANNNLAESQQHYAQVVSEELEQEHFVIGLGGGHEIAWGSYSGLRDSLLNSPSNRIGIVNFDAHFDLRKPAPSASSGTPFRQIAELCQQNDQTFHYTCLGVAKTANTVALFDYAKQSGTRYLLDEACSLDNAKELLNPMLRDIDQLYITVCLDAFPGYLAPGVSAPSSLGISVPFVINCIRWLADSQSHFGYQWQLADIAEMNPEFDIDNRTAKLAARIIFEIMQAKLADR